MGGLRQRLRSGAPTGLWLQAAQGAGRGSVTWSRGTAAQGLPACYKAAARGLSTDFVTVSVLSRRGVPDRRHNRRPPGHIQAPHDQKIIPNATARWLERGLMKAPPRDKKCRMSLVALPSDPSAVCDVFTSTFAISSARLESRRLVDRQRQPKGSAATLLLIMSQRHQVFSASVPQRKKSPSQG